MKKKAKILGDRTKKPARTTLKIPLRTGMSGLELIEVERAAGELRAGLPVIVHDIDASALVLSVETMNRDRVEETLRAAGRIQPFLLLTPERAAALKIRRYTKEALAIPIPPDASAIMSVQELADPSRDLTKPLRGPFNASREPLSSVCPSALLLMKHANLLPSAILWRVARKPAERIAHALGLLSVDAQRIREYRGRLASQLRLVAQANLPLANAKETRVLSFRSPSGAREHLVLLVGNPSPQNPPVVRLHSECFTGDLLGSLKCDCGDQLRGAIKRMSDDPNGGVLLYLAQEGRGIGLTNKLRAYDLQDQGFDTVDANTRLGFESDERQFEAASEILKRLGFKKIRLLTNNPDKIRALKRLGVRIVERVPHAFPSNPHNAAYLDVKARKSGHLLRWRNIAPNEALEQGFGSDRQGGGHLGISEVLSLP